MLHNGRVGAPAHQNIFLYDDGHRQGIHFDRYLPYKKIIASSLLVAGLLCADTIDADLMAFDDTKAEFAEQKAQTAVDEASDVMDGFDESNSTEEAEEKSSIIEGLTGRLTEQAAYSYNGKKPHDNFTSLKSSLFLDYEQKFESGWRFKTNAKAYYDAIYDIRNETYSQDELKEQRSEVELFDAYVEGSLTSNLDVKVGRQVVVWGRSDTIRITDVLNPLDNRRPGMVDIEDLRLPTTMAKFDFFLGDWRVTPIAVLEQRFTKLPAFGSAFNPRPDPRIAEEDYSDITYALSVGGEFSGWDVNFYAARLHDDAGYVKLPAQSGLQPVFKHDKINMFGAALNVLSGSWLFKTELAYFDGLKYSSVQEKSFSRTDALVGFEYNGIADTMISYDFSVRHFNTYDNRLQNELFLPNKNTYQHALRVTSDFLNATLHANYLISLYGSKLDEGGFQRAWIKYDIADAISTNIGVVDYIGGSELFDNIKNSDMIFADISYSF